MTSLSLACRLGAYVGALFEPSPIAQASWLLFDRQGNLSPLVTSGRTTTGTHFDATGTLQTAAAGVPRVSYDPANLNLGPFLLAEEARTNSIRNDTMQGAVAGIPGTVPTNWAIAQPAGLTRTIALNTVGGISVIDITWSGTTTGAGAIAVQTDTNTGVPAASGQTWTGSAYVSVLQDSPAVTVLNMFLQGLTAAPAISESASSNFYASRANLYSRPRTTISLASGTTVNLRQLISTNAINSGVGINFTLRIGLPQLEQGATASSPILTYGTAVTRSADSLSVTNLAATGFNATEGTLYVDGTVPPNLSTFPSVVALSDGSTNNQVHVYAHTSGVYSNVRSGGVIQGDVGRVASPVTGSNFEFAVALRQNDAIAALNSQLGTLDSVLLMPVGMNQLRIGANASGGGQSVNAFRQLAIIPQRVSDSALQRMTRI